MEHRAVRLWKSHLSAAELHIVTFGVTGENDIMNDVIQLDVCSKNFFILRFEGQLCALQHSLRLNRQWMQKAACNITNKIIGAVYCDVTESITLSLSPLSQPQQFLFGSRFRSPTVFFHQNMQCLPTNDGSFCHIFAEKLFLCFLAQAHKRTMMWTMILFNFRAGVRLTIENWL